MAKTKPDTSADKFGDLKRRLFFLLGALVVYRIGAHIPVPGINPNVLADLFNSQQGGILGMFNMFSGGALSRFTIFALGIMPYISASIIMQLMTVASPQLDAKSRNTRATARCFWRFFKAWALPLPWKPKPVWFITRGWCLELPRFPRF